MRRTLRRKRTLRRRHRQYRGGVPPLDTSGDQHEESPYYNSARDYHNRVTRREGDDREYPEMVHAYNKSYWNRVHRSFADDQSGEDSDDELSEEDDDSPDTRELPGPFRKMKLIRADRATRKAANANYSGPYSTGNLFDEPVPADIDNTRKPANQYFEPFRKRMHFLNPRGVSIKHAGGRTRHGRRRRTLRSKRRSVNSTHIYNMSAADHSRKKPNESPRKSFLEIVGADVAINAILVNENIRPAFLVQPADYGEAVHTDPKTALILREIKRHFPALIQSVAYNTYQGAIVSPTDYTGHTIGLNEMGRVLGYPCWADFQQIDATQPCFTIELKATVAGESVQLFANICKDQSALAKFTELKDRAAALFRSDEVRTKYVSVLGDTEVTDIEVVVQEVLASHGIIEKLIHGAALNEKDREKIADVIENLGVDTKIATEIAGAVQNGNRFHAGLVAQLLNCEINDPVSPFYPLQYHPEQQREHAAIMANMVANLLRMIRAARTGPT